MVGLSDAARQTVEERIKRDGLKRRIGARIPEVSGIGPLLAGSNMLATNVKPFLAADMKTYRLVARQPPLELPDITFRLVWSARLVADPGNAWLRKIVIGADERLCAEAMERDGSAVSRRPGQGLHDRGLRCLARSDADRIVGLASARPPPATGLAAARCGAFPGFRQAAATVANWCLFRPGETR